MGEEKIIEIVNCGEERYCLRANFSVFGRMYDNDAESVVVVKPEGEADSICTMVITNNGKVVDHINVLDDAISIGSNLSQYSRVKIGFSFLRANGAVKNSGVEEFYFLKAQKPEGFEPSVPIYSGNVDRLISMAFVDVEWKDGEHNTLVFKGIDGNVLKEINLHGFSQEQANLSEIDNTKATYVHGKRTSNLENDGDGNSPFITAEEAKRLQHNMPQIDLTNYYSKSEADEIIDEVEINSYKILTLGATGTIGTNANFEIENPESYVRYRKNLTEFIFSGIIPVTGAVDLTKEVTITFGDTSYYLFSAIDAKKRLTLRDLDFALKESLVTGYNYLFRTVFYENSDFAGFAVIPDKEDVLSLDSNQMDDFMADGGLPSGQLAICSRVIANGYVEGGIYRFKITYPSTYEWEELFAPSRLNNLTLNQNGSMLTSAETFIGHVHAMIEFDTNGVHYGADFILHPYDSAICLVFYKFGTYESTAYIDESGHINIAIPNGLSFTNFKGHFIKL